MTKAQQRKKSYNASLKVLMDQYNRNLISLEQYKIEVAFLKGRYNVK